MTDGGEDDEADEHPESAADETLTATEVLHHVKTEEGSADVDGTENDGGEVGVFDTDFVEDGGTVVEEVCNLVD